jgi:hypothetical protein
MNVGVQNNEVLEDHHSTVRGIFKMTTVLTRREPPRKPYNIGKLYV